VVFYIEPIITWPGGELRRSFDPTRTQRRQVKCHAASAAAAAPAPAPQLSRRAQKLLAAALAGGFHDYDKDNEQEQEDRIDDLHMRDAFRYFMDSSTIASGAACDHFKTLGGMMLNDADDSDDDAAFAMPDSDSDDGHESPAIVDGARAA